MCVCAGEMQHYQVPKPRNFGKPSQARPRGNLPFLRRFSEQDLALAPLASHAGAPQTARAKRRRGQVPRMRRPVGLHVVVLLGRQGQDPMALRGSAASHEEAGAQWSPPHHREGGVDAVASSYARQAAGCEAAKEDKEAARCQAKKKPPAAKSLSPLLSELDRSPARLPV